MKIRITKAPAQNGLSVEGNKYKTLSTDGINLGGDYHSQGGTMVSSNGEMVEAEKNEPIYTGSDGSNYVFGNLSNPITGTKFKSEGKKLLTEKGKFEKKFDKANQNLEVADPYSKFGSLDFNTAKVQMEAAQIETQALKQELDGLAALQEGILGAAEASGKKPEQISKAMKKNGGKIKVRMGGLPIAKDGDLLKGLTKSVGGNRSVYHPINDHIEISPTDVGNEDVMNHEKFHAYQNRLGTNSLPQFMDAPYKKPSMVSTPEIQGNYFNRGAIDRDLVTQSFIDRNPEFQFIPWQVVDQVYTDQAVYDTPWTMEGEAEQYMNYVKNGGSPMFNKGGKLKAKDGDKLNSFWDTLKTVFQPMTAQQLAQQQNPIQPARPMPAAVQPNAQGTLAQRNNNPGNLRFIGQPGAVKGDAGFAKFDSYESGRQALYNDIRAKQTGKTKTGLGPNSTLMDLMNVYSPASDNNNPRKLAQTLARGMGVSVDSPIGNLSTNKLIDLISINEDAAYASSKGTTPGRAPVQPPMQTVPGTAEAQPITPIAQDKFNPKYDNTPVAQLGGYRTLDVNDQPIVGQQMTQLPYQSPSSPQSPRQLAGGPKRNRLNPINFLGEIAALVDRPDYVQGQQYDPILMSPYRVSFQDQLNQSTGNFNALARTMANNPEALATLQAQKYQQDQSILGNQFRTNQQVQNQVLNQNNQILNQAQLQNNQYGDLQYERMAAAQGITDANRMNALNSISNKYAQNNLYNNERQAQFDSQQRLSNMYGNMYENYSFDQAGDVQFDPGQGINFFANGRMPQANQQAYYDYAAQQNELKKQAKENAAKNRTRSAFGHKFKK